jgi:hypothetical protein
MEAQTLPTNTNNSQFFTILRILIGFISLLPIDIEQLFNGVIAPNWPLVIQIVVLLQGWGINIGS